MPYINQAARERLAKRPRLIEDTGELNYLLTQEMLQWAGYPPAQTIRLLLLEYLADQEPVRYRHYNDIAGAVLLACMEYHRRVGRWPDRAIVDVLEGLYLELGAPYEDAKIAENGDVYPQQEEQHEQEVA